MKLIVLVSLVVLAAGAPQGLVGDEVKEPEIRVLSQYSKQDGQGNYEYSYKLSNGQSVEEVGRSYPGDEPETGSISKEGSFEFVAPNEVKYRVDYRADEGGFQPEGDHLPQKPAQIPEYAQLRQEHPELFVGAFWLNN